MYRNGSLDRFVIPSLSVCMIFFALFVYQVILLYTLSTTLHENPDYLFQRFPLDHPARRANTTHQQLPVPFHCYDADALVFHGQGSFSYFEKLVENEMFTPIHVDDDRQHTLMNIWIMNYIDTAIGGYQEVVVGVLVNQGEHSKRVHCVNEFCLSNLLAFDPEISFYAVKLWLSSDNAIRYGRDKLGLDKVHCIQCHIHRHPTKPNQITSHHADDVNGVDTTLVWKSFHFTDDNDHPLISGHVLESNSIFTQILHIPKMIAQCGFARLLKLLSMGYASQTMLGRPNITSTGFKTYNPRIQGIFKVNPWEFDPKFQLFDEKSDLLILDGPQLGPTQFKPLMYHRSSHMQFVLLSPSNHDGF